MRVTGTEYYGNIISDDAYVDFVDDDGAERHVTVSDMGEFISYVVADRRRTSATWQDLQIVEEFESGAEAAGSRYAELYRLAEEIIKENKR